MSTTPFLDTGVPLPSSTLGTGKSSTNWLLPVAILLLLAAAAYWAWREFQKQKKENAQLSTANLAKDQEINELKSRLKRGFRPPY